MFLNKRELVGSDIESIDIRSKASVGLLAAVRSDQGVDLEAVDVVKLLEGKLDLSLVGLDINDEDEGVVLLHLLHGALSVERVDDNLVLIEARLVGNRSTRVLGSTAGDQGLGAVEGGAVASLDLLVGVCALESGLGSLSGLVASFLSLGILGGHCVGCRGHKVVGGAGCLHLMSSTNPLGVVSQEPSWPSFLLTA
jgi:hypothetical protein